MDIETGDSWDLLFSELADTENSFDHYIKQLNNFDAEVKNHDSKHPYKTDGWKSFHNLLSKSSKGIEKVHKYFY